MVICPFAPYGPKTCQIWHKLGPDFAEHRSLKLLGGFSPFKALWACLRLVVVHCHSNLPISPMWACPWPKTCQMM